MYGDRSSIMHFIETSRGLKWHYDVKGEGPALLFLHGWGVNMRIWCQQVKHFAASFKVITVDLPGHGKSQWQKLSLTEIAGEILEILQYLRIKKLGVIASSLGGLVALKIFELDPGRIRFFVFVGSQPKFAQAGDHPWGLELERISHLRRQLEIHYPSIVHIFFRSLFTREERESRRFHWVQIFRKADIVPEKEALLEFLKMIEKEDLRDVFVRIEQPVQFINGTEDNICRKEVFTELQRTMPDARLDWFDRCGHFSFLSRPNEFNEVLEKFILCCLN